jgi:hypothetical protein
VAGQATVERNRFIQLTGATKSVSRRLEANKSFVRTARHYRTVHIAAGDHILTAADPCPTTYATPLNRSTARKVRTNLSQVGS